jgi:cobaltochelatase CobS
MAFDPNFIVTADSRHLAIAQLVDAGHDPARLHSLTNVALGNLYHAAAAGDTPTDAQRLGARILMDVLAALPHGVPNEEAIRQIVRQEMQTILDAIPPQRLEIVGPRGSVTLDGPHHYRTPIIIQVVALNHATMLIGPAGCGKTTIGEHTAKALQLPFYITSVINDTHELMGFVDGYGKYHTTPFRQAFEHGGVWIGDEIDAWDASALLAANSALANGYANFPDRPERIVRHPDFRIIATANTFGTGADRVYVGRNELDAASLDRFATINVDYDLDLERMFANGADAWLDHVWKVRKSVNEKRIRHVVSSRAISTGAAALAAGIPWDEVNEMYLFKGMSEKDRLKVD